MYLTYRDLQRTDLGIVYPVFCADSWVCFRPTSCSSSWCGRSQASATVYKLKTSQTRS
jgi:hypothetical protein